MILTIYLFFFATHTHTIKTTFKSTIILDYGRVNEHYLTNDRPGFQQPLYISTVADDACIIDCRNICCATTWPRSIRRPPTCNNTQTQVSGVFNNYGWNTKLLPYVINDSTWRMIMGPDVRPAAGAASPTGATRGRPRRRRQRVRWRCLVVRRWDADVVDLCRVGPNLVLQVGEIPSDGRHTDIYITSFSLYFCH